MATLTVRHIPPGDADIAAATEKLRAECRAINGSVIEPIPGGFALTVDGMTWPMLHVRASALARRVIGERGDELFDFD